MSQLPDDLRGLGADLEAAAARAVRRRARRQTLVSGAGAVLVAVPLAVGVSASDVAPDRQPWITPTPGATAVPAAPVDLPAITTRRFHHEAYAAPCPDCGAPAWPLRGFVPAGRT
jgi:hypothetical protein